MQFRRGMKFRDIIRAVIVIKVGGNQRTVQRREQLRDSSAVSPKSDDSNRFAMQIAGRLPYETTIKFLLKEGGELSVPPI